LRKIVKWFWKNASGFSISWQMASYYCNSRATRMNRFKCCPATYWIARDNQSIRDTSSGHPSFISTAWFFRCFPCLPVTAPRNATPPTPRPHTIINYLSPIAWKNSAGVQGMGKFMKPSQSKPNAKTLHTWRSS